jgi:hypothetical protein
MSGMGSTLQLTNSTVVAAFRSALIHQGIVALLIFFLLAVQRLPGANGRGGRVSVWTLGPGSGTWSRSQAMSAAIPYGSSG